MNGRMGRDHLQLDPDPMQMFECARTASSAVYDRGKRLARPLHIGRVEGVLEHARYRAIAFCDDEDVAVVTGTVCCQRTASAFWLGA